MATTAISKGVEPLFLKDRDIASQDITPYNICKALETIVRATSIDGVQKIGGIWRLYFKDKESRTNVLLKRTVTIVGKNIAIYDQNPFATKQANPDDKKDKLTIKNVPLSVSNEEIQKMLESKNIKLSSKVKFSYIRDEQGSLTGYRNGDRFVYCEPFDPPIQVKQKVGNFQCLVFHHGKDHRICKSCNQTGHRPGDEKCLNRAEPGTILAFSSYQHPLSNHYPAPVKAFDEKEPFKSVEHALFWGMATDLGQPNLAKKIRNAKHAGVAKALSKQMDEEDRDKWEDDNLDNISTILHEKAKTCAPFRRCLLENRDKLLAECTSNLKWASGLPKNVTEITQPSAFPGKNLLGALLMDIQKADLLKYEQEAADSVASAATVEDKEDVLAPAASSQDAEETDNIPDEEESDQDEAATPAAPSNPEKRKKKKGRRKTKTTQKANDQGTKPDIRNFLNHVDPETGKRKTQDSTPEKCDKDKIQKTNGKG